MRPKSVLIKYVAFSATGERAEQERSEMGHAPQFELTFLHGCIALETDLHATALKRPTPMGNRE
jgi:hypothetical protein